MKFFFWLVLAAALLFTAQSAAADDKKGTTKPDDSLKIVIDQLEKEWGIKLKSSSKKEAKAKTETELKLTLDFTKDVSDLTEMRKAFIALPAPPRQIATHPLVFHLFDKDNVSIGKYTIRKIEGDLTGTKGDSFRIILICETAMLDQATKLEARLKEAPKK